LRPGDDQDIFHEPAETDDEIRPRVRAPVSRSSCVRSHRWPLIRHRVGRV